MGAVLRIKDKDGNIIPIRAIKGPKGDPGKDGVDGKDGAMGPQGKSAFDLAKENGATAETEAEWLETLKPFNAPLPQVGSAVTITDGKGTAPDELESGSVYLVLGLGGSGILRWDTSNELIHCATSFKSDLVLRFGVLRIATENNEITTLRLNSTGNAVVDTSYSGTLYFYKLGYIPS